MNINSINQVKRMIAFLGVLLVFVQASVVSAQMEENRGEQQFGSKKDVLFIPMLIEYERELAPVSAALTEVLRVRLGRYGVEISQRPFEEKSDSRDDGENTPDCELEAKPCSGDEETVSSVVVESPVPEAEYQWIVTLRRISERHLIVTIDSADEEKSVSEVRTVSFHPALDQLSWTMGLVVEEAVVAYLEWQDELPALGAGLAILEPKEVGGTKKKAAVKPSPYPKVHGLGIGLTLSGIWSIDEILTGPKLYLKGIFSRRTVAMFAVGWQGSAEYGGAGISGSMSQIPIELYVGGILFKKRVLRIVGWAGVSVGFSVYKTQNANTSRTDMTFQPGGNLLLEIVAVIVSPLEFFLQGGFNFPFVRDVLVNNETEIYSHVWVMPTVTVGLQLGF